MKKYLTLALFVSNCVFANEAHVTDKYEELGKLEKDLAQAFEEPPTKKFKNLLNKDKLFQDQSQKKETCGKILFRAIINGNEQAVKYLLKGGCPIDELEPLPDQKPQYHFYDKRTTEEWITTQKSSTPLWAAQNICKGKNCKDIIQFLCSKQAPSQAGIEIKRWSVVYPSEGDAFAEMGGRNVTHWKGIRLLDK